MNFNNVVGKVGLTTCGELAQVQDFEEDIRIAPRDALSSYIRNEYDRTFSIGKIQDNE